MRDSKPQRSLFDSNRTDIPSEPTFEHRVAQHLVRLVGLRRMLAGSAELTRLEVQIPDLPPELDGFTIAQVSDFHVGEGLWLPGDAARAAELVRSVHPDVVINTGDYLQGMPEVERVGVEVEPFVQRRPGSPSPNLAVLGNHDYYAGEVKVAQLTRELERLGVSVLVNQATCVLRRGCGVSFVGLTDEVTGFEQGVATLLSAARPRIALVHQPDLAERLPPGSADLVLSGHTHGGQIALPGLTAEITRRFAKTNYVAGLYSVDDMPVYVNRGLGYSGLPVRFQARPEVTCIRLTR